MVEPKALVHSFVMKDVIGDEAAVFGPQTSGKHAKFIVQKRGGGELLWAVLAIGPVEEEFVEGFEFGIGGGAAGGHSGEEESLRFRASSYRHFNSSCHLG